MRVLTEVLPPRQSRRVPRVAYTDAISCGEAGGAGHAPEDGHTADPADARNDASEHSTPPATNEDSPHREGAGRRRRRKAPRIHLQSRRTEAAEPRAPYDFLGW